ncbi:demethoxyubiquinone hydroxylase family protein [Pseudomonas solani]|uniref:demethoxyubiquinone hydroxylase family protein n=1 Tax=Pseudomonas solani TaxID=2731552 RepID=UPI0022359C51|nr:demethoxyubiquinone hydroxylase family protein [Pseudomonas solani]
MLNTGSRFLKVNHAGEMGAVCIYSGQIFMARLMAPSLVDRLREFREHERGHREVFRAELAQRGVSRCRSYWLCAGGGLLLGLITGLLGQRAIATTTAAVEHVVLRHLDEQLATLADQDPAASACIGSILAEEQQHHDEWEELAGGHWTYSLAPLVRLSTEAVIQLGLRL